MNQSEFDEFLKYYYRDPAPARAPEALRHVATAPGNAGAMAIASYFFQRIAQDNPGLIWDEETLLREAPEEGKAFVRDLLDAIKANPSGPVTPCSARSRAGGTTISTGSSFA